MKTSRRARDAAAPERNIPLIIKLIIQFVLTHINNIYNKTYNKTSNKTYNTTYNNTCNTIYTKNTLIKLIIVAEGYYL